MSTPKPTVLESLQLAETLLGEVKKQQKISKKKIKPPKWLLGRETLFKPKETPDQYKERWKKKLNLTDEEYLRLQISFLM
jgi:hypothetical protein